MRSVLCVMRQVIRKEQFNRTLLPTIWSIKPFHCHYPSIGHRRTFSLRIFLVYKLVCYVFSFNSCVLLGSTGQGHADKGWIAEVYVLLLWQGHVGLS